MRSVRLHEARGRWVLLATILGSSLAMLDSTVVNVALRRIGTELDADLGDLQWTLSAYALTLASFVLLGGALGDHAVRGRDVHPAGRVPREQRTGDDHRRYGDEDTERQCNEQEDPSHVSAPLS